MESILFGDLIEDICEKIFKVVYILEYSNYRKECTGKKIYTSKSEAINAIKKRWSIYDNFLIQQLIDEKVTFFYDEKDQDIYFVKISAYTLNQSI